MLSRSAQAGGDLSWGPYEVGVESAAGRFHFEGLSAEQADDLAHRYGRLTWDRADGESDVVCVGARLEEPLDLPAEYFAKDEQYTPSMQRGAQTLAITGFNFTADVQWGRPVRARLSVAREDELARPVVVENFMRVLSGYLALDRGGILLHSAGLLLGNTAFLFIGRSGAGKTTLTRKAHALGLPVLSDDINLLLPCPGGYRAFPVPFAGEFGESPSVLACTGYPLGGVFLLHHGDELAVRPISAVRATAQILAASPFVNTDVTRVGEVLDRITALVTRAPALELVTTPADGFAAIRELLEVPLNA